MRWFELTAILTIGALFGGAYLLGYHPEVFGIFQSETVLALSSGNYVIVHQIYLTRFLAVMAAATAVYVVVLTVGSSRARIMGAVALVIGSGGLSLALWPQHFLPRNGMPRRYIDYPEAFERLNMISGIGFLIAVGAALLLVVIVLFCLWRRFTVQPA